MIKQRFKFRLTNFNSLKLSSSKCLKTNDDYTAHSKLKDSNLIKEEDVTEEDILSVEDESKVEDESEEEDKLKKKDNSKEEYMLEKEDIIKKEDTIEKEDITSEDKVKFKIKLNDLSSWRKTWNNLINFSTIKQLFCYNENEIINLLSESNNEENLINVKMKVTVDN